MYLRATSAGSPAGEAMPPETVGAAAVVVVVVVVVVAVVAVVVVVVVVEVIGEYPGVLMV